MPLKMLFGLLGGLVVLAFLANRLFRHTRIPDLLVLIAMGLLIGPVLGWVNAGQFKPVTHAFGTLALILILFEGGLELRLRDTLKHFSGGVLLAVVAYGLTFVLVSAVVERSLSFPLIPSLLVGAVVACTSSSMVLPILQQLKLSEPVRVTLVLESALGDVLGVLTVEYLIELDGGLGLGGGLLAGLFWKIALPLVIALVAGILWSRLLPVMSEERFWHVLTFGVVLLLYAGTEAVNASGLIAVLGFGLTLANFPRVERALLKDAFEFRLPEDEDHVSTLSFHSELSFLVRTFFFVLLGVVVEFADVRYVPATLGILGAIFVARWLTVRALRFSWRAMQPNEHEMVLWIFPRGLITAVLAIQVLATRGPAFAFLPAIAFIVILATNLVVIVAGFRARHHAPAPQPTPAP